VGLGDLWPHTTAHTNFVCHGHQPNPFLSFPAGQTFGLLKALCVSRAVTNRTRIVLGGLGFAGSSLHNKRKNACSWTIGTCEILGHIEVGMEGGTVRVAQAPAVSYAFIQLQ
jgi:hypothetical protein